MTQAQTQESKPTVVVDIISDTVCPWCYVGKRRLEKAKELLREKVQVEARWHPYQLNPAAPMEGVNKMQMYREKFGEARIAQMLPQMTKTFKELDVDYSMGGLTGNTLNSHRLIHYAGRFGTEKQNALVDALFDAYFSKEQFINDRAVLLAAADKVGIEGAADLLDDPTACLEEVKAELAKARAMGVSGVPHFSIGGLQVSGAQEPRTLAAAIAHAAGILEQ